MPKKDRIGRLLILFVSTFVIAVSTALLAYILSSFLGTILNPKFVGIVFTVSYCFSLLAIHYFSHFINFLGKFYSLIILLFLGFISLLGIAIFKSSLASLFLFAIYNVVGTLIWINLDVFIEYFSKDIETGRIRGANLTIMNLGWVISPILSGFLLSKYGFSFLFFLSAFILLPVILMVVYNFEKNKTRFHKPAKVKKVFGNILEKKSLRSIFYLAFLLQVFYSWMVIYTPIYLRTLEFSWEQIGQTFTIMLIPFVLLQYPAGYLADKYFGETEMLTAGVIIMSLATIGLFFISSHLAIIALLFLTRVGASTIEILRDSYFYKQINVQDINIIDYFRNTGPLAYIISPLAATLIIYFLPMNYLYLFLGLFCLSGLWFTLRMPDTK